MRRILVFTLLGLLVVAPAMAQLPLTASAVLLSAATTTGASSAFNTAGMDMVAIEVTQTGTANTAFQASIGGSTWATLGCYQLGWSVSASSANASGIFRCNVQGIPQIRVSATITSGTVTAQAFARQGPLPVVTP